MFTQQFSGINAVIFYGETILEMTSVGMDSLVELVIFACVQVVACIISVMLIDKVTRFDYSITRLDRSTIYQSLGPFPIRILP